jgi:hypothetical protein
MKLLLLFALTLAAVAAACASLSSPTTAAPPSLAPEIVSQIASRLIAEAIPREYERSKDWGRTKNITTGLRSSGNFFDFDIHRRKTAVNHGVWKKYRVELVEPEQNLVVRVENLRTIAPGQYALTLFITTKLHGWARAKVYDRGIHLIAVEAEGDAKIALWLDAEFALERVSTETYVPGIALRPRVTAARLALEEFRITRISDIRGAFARELGQALRDVIEEELSGPKLAAKLNAAIDKRRDRLEFTPQKLFADF